MFYQIINCDETSRMLVKKLLKNGKTCFAFFQKTQRELKFVRPSDESEWQYANKEWKNVIYNVNLETDPFPVLLKSESFVYVFFEKSNLIRLYKKTNKGDHNSYSEIPENLQSGLNELFKKIISYNKKDKYYIEKFALDENGKFVFFYKTPLKDGLKKWIQRKKDRNISLTFTL